MQPRIPLPSHFDSRALTVKQGREAGLSAKRLRGPDLLRPFPGIRVPAGIDLNPQALAAALQRKLPRQAYFSGVTAAVVMGLPLPARLELSTTVHVSVPSSRTAPTGNGIIGHSVATTSSDVREWNGIRISTPPRTWCELATELTVPDLVAVGDYLVSVSHPLSDVDELRREVLRNRRRRGNKRLLVAVDLLDGRSESRRGSILLVIVVTADLGEVTPNLPIRTSGGFAYRADLAFRNEKVIIEYQSDYHRNPEQFRRDMTRISRLQADGWFVIQVNADDLDNPAELVQRIRRVLRTRVTSAE